MKRLSSRLLSHALLQAVWVYAVFCEHAHAQTKREEPQAFLLSEPTEFTSVLDGFVGGTLPDVRVSLSFRRSTTRSVLAREHALEGDKTAGRSQHVAISRQVTNALSLNIAIGVFRDLMVYLRVPLVLSDRRELTAPSGVSRDQVESILRSGVGALETSLFELPYQSATRSGLPGIELGVAWGLANQFRTPYLPTWVVSLDTRIDLGQPMSACTDRGGCDAGISRGTLAFNLDTRWSYRVRFVEPYLGLRFMREWATTAASAFAKRGAVPSEVDTTPPTLQELTLGAALMAYEDRARFQRVTVDVRGYAAYISEGRDYSPLFDALGTSINRQLSDPYRSPTGEVRSNGLTNVASYARFGAEVAVATQAARYVHFRLGVLLSHSTAHVLTNTPACVAASGGCTGDRVNPLYRPIIDLPGQRFLQVGDLSYDLFAQATGEF